MGGSKDSPSRFERLMRLGIIRRVTIEIDLIGLTAREVRLR